MVSLLPDAGDRHGEKPCCYQCDCGGSVLLLGGRGSLVRCATLVDYHPSLRNARQIARFPLAHSRRNPAGYIWARSLAETELTLTLSPKNRARAEAAFKKPQQVQVGEKAKTEYEAESQSVREKTARLRTLRLAKEAIELPVKDKDELCE